SCARRNRSTIAPQALILLNSEFSLSAARDLAGFVLAGAGDDASRQVTLAYSRTLGRDPTASELDGATKFLDQQADELKSSGRSTSGARSTPPARLRPSAR